MERMQSPETRDITSLHPGLSRAKSNGTCRCSAVRRLSSPRSPDVVLGERVLRMLISCPECHRIPLTRSVFMFGTIEDTPNIIRTGCIYVHSLWQDLSMSTKIFDLVTLTLEFDLLLKNFNLGYSFFTRRGWAFIFHMCIPCSKTFNALPWFLT